MQYQRDLQQHIKGQDPYFTATFCKAVSIAKQNTARLHRTTKAQLGQIFSLVGLKLIRTLAYLLLLHPRTASLTWSLQIALNKCTS